MLALPLRYGGLGIQNPTKTADREYQASRKITSQLTNLIFNQDQDLSKLDMTQIIKTKADLKHEKELSYTAEKSRVFFFFFGAALTDYRQEEVAILQIGSVLLQSAWLHFGLFP